MGHRERLQCCADTTGCCALPSLDSLMQLRPCCCCSRAPVMVAAPMSQQAVLGSSSIAASGKLCPSQTPATAAAAAHTPAGARDAPGAPPSPECHQHRCLRQSAGLHLGEDAWWSWAWGCARTGRAAFRPSCETLCAGGGVGLHACWSCCVLDFCVWFGGGRECVGLHEGKAV